MPIAEISHDALLADQPMREYDRNPTRPLSLVLCWPEASAKMGPCRFARIAPWQR